jgi:hypothetical protein
MKRYAVINECGEEHGTYTTQQEAEAEQLVCESHIEEGQYWEIEDRLLNPRNTEEYNAWIEYITRNQQQWHEKQEREKHGPLFGSYQEEIQ